MTEAGLAARSGLSWGAIFAGGLVATALTIMLLALGSGLGLSSLSVTGAAANPGVATFTALSAAWLVITQWLSSGLGGYLAGRLRAGSSGVIRDEVFFRDTAQGLVAWSLATVLVVGAALSGVGGLVGHGTAAVASAGGASGPAALALDELFLPEEPGSPEAPADVKATAGRLLASGVGGRMDASTRSYLASVVAFRTGVSADAAATRVDGALASAQSTARATKKAVADFALYTFFSMLVGAFIACVAGAIGGRQRDLV